MSQSVVNLACPSCGAPAQTSTTTCLFCRRPIVISTFTAVADMSLPDINKYAKAYRSALAENPQNQVLNNSLGMCYVKLKLYEKAISAFEKALEEDVENSETMFYAAVVLLKGKKAFLAPRETINQVEEYINAAIMIEPRGIYYYFQAYIKYDYYARKCFNTSPTYQAALESAKAAGYHPGDVEQLFALLGVEKPEGFD
jgi:tetratricopeptide (TPR) repeat protein